MHRPSETFQSFRILFIVTAIPVAMMGCGPATEVAAPPAIQGETRTFSFAPADEGNVPSGWNVEQTGKGEGSAWQVLADGSSASDTGYVLAQTAKSPRSMFNLCVVEDSLYRDVQLTVAFKAVEGEVDQGGGLVWRYADANNYYVCRFNPLEDSLRIYKVIAGKRKQLASVDAELPAGQWHILTATMKGGLIVCEAGGTRLSVRDDTLTRAGRIGLWTKADAQTYFDQFAVTGSAD